MNSVKVRNAYRKAESQAKIHPVKLIHLMYDRILTHLELAEDGISGNDPKMRGENLGKAIALVTELYASIKEDDITEAAQFLRGLYNAILIELPKVSVSGDVQILRQTHIYITRLKEIWEQTAMAELVGKEKGEGATPVRPVVQAQDYPSSPPESVRGVSFSI